MKNSLITLATFILTAASTSCNTTKDTTTDTRSYHDSLSFTARQKLIERIDSMVRSDQFEIILDSLHINTPSASINAHSARIVGKSFSVSIAETRIAEVDSATYHSTNVATINTRDKSVRQIATPSLQLFRILAVTAIVGALLIVLKIKRKK